MAEIENAKFGEVYRWVDSVQYLIVMCVDHRGDNDWTVLLLSDGEDIYTGEISSDYITHLDGGGLDTGWVKVHD